MRHVANYLFILALSSLAGPAIAADAPARPAADKTETPARGWALLAGCTAYDHHPSSALEGPVNDVELMKAMLVNLCGFDPQRIRHYSEAKDALGRPTRANIKAGFDWLRDSVGKGDNVVILLAGHGSQQPVIDHDPVRNPEPDGLDETFLPCDIGGLVGMTQGVEGAIIDDELGQWTRAIAERGAFVWIMLDSCHSGSALRGDSKFRLRRINPEELGVTREMINESAVEAAKHAPPSSTRTRGQATVSEDKRVAGIDGITAEDSIIGLYAAQSNEPESETLMPPEGTRQQWRGLLSYSVCQILEQGPSPTYRELQQRIVAQYGSWGWTAPTPSVEGTAIDRVVLDQKSRPPTFQLAGDKSSGYTITAGQLRGLTPGSVLSVRNPLLKVAGEASDKKLVGYVRIKSSDLLQSVVEPYEFDGQPAVADLPDGGICEVVYAELGSAKLRVTVDFKDRAQDEVLLRIAEQLTKLSADTSALFEFTPNLADAHWAVQFREDAYWLMPAAQATTLGPLTKDKPHFQISSTIKDADLNVALTRAARVRNLLGLVKPITFSSARGDSAQERSEFDVRVEMLKFDGPDDRAGVPLRLDSGVVLHDKDRVAWRIENRGTTAADVTLLYVDSQLAIIPLFPRSGSSGENRIAAGQTFPTKPVRVNIKTTGREQVVAIVVKAESLHGPRGPSAVTGAVDFTFLAQSSPAGVLSRSPSFEANQSPLAKLLKSNGISRGFDLDEMPAYSVQDLAWDVAP